MKSWKTLKKQLLSNKGVAKEYRRLTPRYQAVSQLIEARRKLGYTQNQLAQKLKTQQSAVARFESGEENLTLDLLEKFAAALKSKVTILIG
ncbi:MAG: helix-turn-helix transcriptional regulator [Patescibacteria group bacterium]